MDKTRGNLPLTITLGALWGLLEVKVGWGMHLLHLPYRSLLFFPIGVTCMIIGVYRTGRSVIALEIAVVATLIKLTNLLMPRYFPLYYVINPAIAIGLEGVAVYLFCRMFAAVGSRWLAYSLGPQWLAASGLLLAVFFFFRIWQEIMFAWMVGNLASLASERRFAGTAIGEILILSRLKGRLLVWLAHWLKPPRMTEFFISWQPFILQKPFPLQELFISRQLFRSPKSPASSQLSQALKSCVPPSSSATLPFFIFPFARRFLSAFRSLEARPVS